MRWLSLAVLLLFTGCAAPATLFIPTAIQKSSVVNVKVLPVEDESKEYRSEFQLEKLLEDNIAHGFKGRWITEREPRRSPLFQEIPNPYVISSSSDSADVIVKQIVEQVYFGNISRSVATGYLLGGVIGAALTDRNNKKVAGVIRIRMEITTGSGELLLSKAIYGKSESEYPDRITQAAALKDAAKSVSDQALLLFCQSTKSDEARSYYKNLKKKAQ